jgi:hypothetical protein
MVLQQLLEADRPGSLDAVTDSLVLEPLGMRSSWYGRAARESARAYGHIALGRAVLPFALVFAPLFLALLAVAAVARRVSRGPWRPPPIGVAVALPAAAGATMWFLQSRAAAPGAALTFTLFGLGSLALLAVVFAAAHAWAGSRARAARVAIGTAAGLVMAVGLAPQQVPLPDLASKEGNAASSLRTSARDLGRFLEELSLPRLLTASTATEYGGRHVALDSAVAWGLGIGVQTDINGKALFHWGSNPAARSFLLCYPVRGRGIAVLANGDLSRAGVVRIVEAALGGGTAWRLH